jgi:hypothetical protein
LNKEIYGLLLLCGDRLLLLLLLHLHVCAIAWSGLTSGMRIEHWTMHMACQFYQNKQVMMFMQTGT